MGLITVNWHAPPQVHAFQTTREGGVSLTPYDSWNLANHVHDAPDAVQQNRTQLAGYLPATPYWLNQTHSTQVVCADDADPALTPTAECQF